MDTLVYVSITGLKLKRFWHAPKFWRLALVSMSQAKAADGCLSAEARTINGVHHTLSVWTSKNAMKAYLYKDAHMRAIKEFGSIATGKTFGFETTKVPAWDKVHALWQEKGHVA